MAHQERERETKLVADLVGRAQRSWSWRSQTGVIGRFPPSIALSYLRALIAEL